MPTVVLGANQSWPDGRGPSPQSSLSLAISALYRIPREGPWSGSSTKAKGFPRPHPVSQCGNHPAGRLPGSQAAERKGLLKVALSSHAGRCQLETAWLCACQDLSSYQTEGNHVLWRHQKTLWGWWDHSCPKQQTGNVPAFKGRRLLTQNITLRKALPSLLQDNQNFSQTPHTRVSLLW